MEGKIIKEKLYAAGMSQKKLAEILEVTPQSVNSILNASDVRSGTIEKLSKALGVPVSNFYGGGEQSVSVGEQASASAPIAALHSNRQDHSSLNGSYNSPELVQALIAQLDRKDDQLKVKDDQLKVKDEQLRAKDDHISRLLSLLKPS